MKTPIAIAIAALAFALVHPLAGAADDHAQHKHSDHSQHAPAAGKNADKTVDHSQHQMPAAEKPSSVKVRFDDSVLIDQDGQARKLKSEIIGDKIIVIDFAYTTCTTVCPVLTALMAKVQRGLADSQTGNVQLLTLTVDPARDTPARLKAYAAQYGAQPGWTWLTGPTGRVNEVLKGFGAYAPRFEDHPPLVLVGDPKSGHWTRFVGFADPQDILGKVRELAAARDKHAGHAGHQH